MEYIFAALLKICWQGKRHLKLLFKSVQVLFSRSENILMPKEFCLNLKQVVWQAKKGKAKNDNSVSEKM